MRPLPPLALAAAALAGGAACRRAPAGPPWSPAESIATMRVLPGLRVEPFAAEPTVASPVAMEFDEHGRVFVVEMPGYPLDTKPTGRLKLLEDRDRDGRYETVTLFADGLVLPTGVMRWKGGVLVTAAPDVWYLEDRDGDGRADVKTKVLTGFAFTNPQHTVNGPVYGLDNWIYLAHEGAAEAIVFKDRFGDRGAGVRFAEAGGEPLDAQGRGVRFRPETREVETLAARSQFGHAFDDFGRYFTLDNSNHTRHEVIAARYLRRNPDLLLPSAMQDVSDHGAAATVFPITRQARFEMLSEPGQFTSACSLTFVPGGPLRDLLGLSSVVAEPVHNLVHRDLWSAAGSTFSARRVDEGQELLAAADAWFRPVGFAAGPDGALYVLDYYRPMIEHPEWTAEHHHHDSPALYQGSDRGRIYRLAAASQPGLAAAGPLPGGATPAQRVAMLAHPNLWWRRTAQRLLVDGRPPEAPALLEALLRESPSPLGRLHALWTLEGLGRLTPAHVAAALRDPEPGVRENALVLSERFPGDATLAAQLPALASDPDPRVRFQLACTLGSHGSPAARAAADKLLLDADADRWVAVAVLSASSERSAAALDRALHPTRGLTQRETPGRASLLREAAGVVGARRRPAEIGRLLSRLAAGRDAEGEWWRAAVLEGVARGLRRARGADAVPVTAQGPLLSLALGPAARLRRPALELLALTGLREAPETRAALARAEARVADGVGDAQERADALALLALGRPPPGLDRLRAWTEASEPEVVQLEAVKAMGRTAGEAPGLFLLSRWRALTPAVRAAAAEVLLEDQTRTRLLLGALRDGRVAPASLGFWSKRDLLMHDDPAVRAEAHALLEERAGDKDEVLRRYEAALDRAADPARGARVFADVCARCHRFRGTGTEVGPDLGTVAGRPPSLLLKDILLPSLSIAPHYQSYLVERVSGGTEEGVLAAQTPTAIVLRREGGEERVIPRADVRSLQASQLSSMPSDLEQQIDEQQMADLLRYLASRP